MLSSIRKFARTNPFIREFIAFRLAPSGFFDGMILNANLNDYWKRRVRETIDCNDNKDIPRVKDAGQVIKGKQIMHNGIKIHLGSYYGPEVAQVLYENKGVHEPQEEKVFQEVLKVIPTGATMIEMGAFWSFYSMWFNREVKDAKNFMIEPMAFNMKCGIRNFKLNNMKGDFTQAFIGEKSSEANGNKTVCIDDFVKEKEIDFINLLHSDIQGFEYDMLKGAEQTIDAKKVGFIFISTHNNDVHQQCLDFLKNKNFKTIAISDMDETFSEDGLIVAHSQEIIFEKKVTIALKEKNKVS